MSNWEKAIIAAAFCFLVFVGGAITGAFRIFPYPVVAPFVDAVTGARAAAQLEAYNFSARWYRAAPEKSGVTGGLSGAAYGDYTLFTSTHDTTARLIDMQGRVVRSWDVPYSRAFDNQEHLLAPRHMEDEYFYLRDFHLEADGGLILMYGAGGLTPWGAGLVRTDGAGKIIWRLPLFFYNNFDVAEGRVYGLYHQVRKTRIEGLDGFQTPFLEDTVGIVDAKDGKLLDSISIPEAFSGTPFAPMLARVAQEGTGDYTHTNSVYRLRRAIPAAPWLKEGNLLLSLRNMNMMAVIDPAAGKVVHAAFLPFRRQHIIHPTPRGTLHVFDNQGGSGAGGSSRVVEFDPVTLAFRRVVTGVAESPLSSLEWGYYQELPNRNLLVAIPENGGMMEVAPSGERVWEYFMPERNEGRVPAITSLRRYAAKDLPFPLINNSINPN